LNKWLQDYPYRIQIQWYMVAIAGGLALALAIVTVSSQALKAAMSNPSNSLRSE
jgi:putative ABC transport system permease protein